MQSMTGFVPKVEVEDVGSDDFFVSSFPVLGFDVVDECVVNSSSVW